MNKVVLLIPHYNNISGLKKSVKSIGKDEKIDLLIVDDGSDILIDEQEIKSCFKAKGNCYFMYSDSNKGVAFSRNKGLKFILKSGYKYTAMLDCGDTCRQDRFEMQYKYLKKHRYISIVGSFVVFVEPNEKFLFKLKLPTKHKKIYQKMFFNPMLIQPSIMFSNEILSETGFYPEKYNNAGEDFAFVFNVVKKYKSANINEVLVNCELNPKGLSVLKRKQQATNRIKIILDNFYLGYYPVIGLFRSLLLYLIPQRFLLSLKKMIKR